MLEQKPYKTVINTILGEEERNLTSLDDMECSLISELGTLCAVPTYGPCPS